MEMYNNVDEIENLCNGIKYHCILMLLSSSTLPVSNASRGIAANYNSLARSYKYFI
jgi:hypothetical protein